MMQHILDKAVAGQRITMAEGLELMQSHDLVADRFRSCEWVGDLGA